MVLWIKAGAKQMCLLFPPLCFTVFAYGAIYFWHTNSETCSCCTDFHDTASHWIWTHLKKHNISNIVYLASCDYYTCYVAVVCFAVHLLIDPAGLFQTKRPQHEVGIVGSCTGCTSRVVLVYWQAVAVSLTYHPYGSRWSPLCVPLTLAQPETPGWWPLGRSGHHARSRRCTASAWCLVSRSLSSHRSHRCSIWLHNSPPWHWLSQIYDLQDKKENVHCVLSALVMLQMTSGATSQWRVTHTENNSNNNMHCFLHIFSMLCKK